VYYLREDFVVRCLRSWTVDCVLPERGRFVVRCLRGWTVDCVLPERGLCCEVFAELDCGLCIT